MARIRLTARDAGSDSFELPDGTKLTAKAPRLFARLRVGPSPEPGVPDIRPIRRAIVDTGMPVTVFPPNQWEDLSFAPVLMRAEQAGGFPETRRPILGCLYRFRLARITVAPLDSDGDDLHLPARDILARLLIEPTTRLPGSTPLQHVVLGMAEGVLEGRTLTFRHARAEADREAWLDDPAG